MSELLHILLRSWAGDLWFFTQWWAWVFLLAFFYMPIFCLKWLLFTLPVWLPVCIIMGRIKVRIK